MDTGSRSRSRREGVLHVLAISAGLLTWLALALGEASHDHPPLRFTDVPVPAHAEDDGHLQWEPPREPVRFVATEPTSPAGTEGRYITTIANPDPWARCSRPPVTAFIRPGDLLRNGPFAALADPGVERPRYEVSTCLGPGREVDHPRYVAVGPSFQFLFNSDRLFATTQYLQVSLDESHLPEGYSMWDVSLAVQPRWCGCCRGERHWWIIRREPGQQTASTALFRIPHASVGEVVQPVVRELSRRPPGGR